MGLAGRKQKQHIPTDPRNPSWTDYVSRFGLSYFSKVWMGCIQGPRIFWRRDEDSPQSPTKAQYDGYRRI
ncbi:hypothetical protein V8E55_011828, partial [Tylopilus felleus]